MEFADKARIIAFYLPQFHPIPENDAWWGRGFTEWTNVAKARPLFRGHYQPHLPADLGFYDLRLPETRQAQADLAEEYGIHGFCYYHYWFHGRRLLERPFDDVLASEKPDFPFCLCWANENWTRIWDGRDTQVLMEQTFSGQDDRDHIRWLIRAFKDPRYIKIHGKPLFLVYRVDRLPDGPATAKLWREEVARAGLPGMYLCSVVGRDPLHTDPGEMGLDAAVDFQPHWEYLPAIKRSFLYKLYKRFYTIRKRMARHRPRDGNRGNAVFTGRRPLMNRVKDFVFRNVNGNYVSSYSRFVRSQVLRPEPKFKVFPGVTPGWDNSPRRKIDYLIFKDSTPEAYQQWLRHAIATSLKRFDGEERIVFINAWNEWAEGNHLEPDQKWGKRYLECTRAAIHSVFM